MKAIIITDADAKALLDKLELKKLRGEGHIMREDFDRPPTIGDIHRAFHFVVVGWLQEQGVTL